MEKKKEQPLKVNATFEELMRISTKGNPKPKRKANKKEVMINLNWIGWTDNRWYPFFTFDIDEIDENAFGVFIVRQKEESGRFVCTGQGNIKKQILNCRSSAELVNYRGRVLILAWAEAQDSQLDGIEAYLNDKYDPIIKKEFPGVLRIEINLPNQ